MLGITRFKTIEEAITIVNNSQYGLAAAVHGKDVARATQIASQIDCGNVSVNSHTLDGSPVGFFVFVFVFGYNL